MARVDDCRGRRVGLLVRGARQGHNLQLLDLAHWVAVASDWVRSIGNRLYWLHLRKFSGDLLLLLLLEDHIERAQLLLIVLPWFDCETVVSGMTST